MPCTIVECSVESGLGERYREAYSTILEVLEAVKNAMGDPNAKIETLVRGVDVIKIRVMS